MANLQTLGGLHLVNGKRQFELLFHRPKWLSKLIILKQKRLVGEILQHLGCMKKNRENTGDKTTNNQEYWRHASDFREALQDDIFRTKMGGEFTRKLPFACFSAWRLLQSQ